VKPFLVASSTRWPSWRQRLVRKICKKCIEPYTPTDAEMRALGMTADLLKGANGDERPRLQQLQQHRQPRDVSASLKFSSLMTEARKLIYDRAPTSVLRARGARMGMRTLREDGIRKNPRVLTTPEEVIAPPWVTRNNFFMSYSMSDLLQLFVSEVVFRPCTSAWGSAGDRVHGILHRRRGSRFSSPKTPRS